MRKALLGLLLLFGVTGLTYSLVTPVFEAPDEVWHYAYVRYLAEGHGLPALTDDESGAYQEVAQPPLYYAVAALFTAPVSDDDLQEVMWHNPGFGYQAGGTVNDNKNMLIHTEREGFPWRGAVLALRLARFVSLAFGLATVAGAWGLARETFPGRPRWALSVAVVVALTPQFLFISGVASNDSAAAALSTAALWAIARAARMGATLRRTLAVGLAVGLAALVKTSCLLLLPVALLALGLGRRRSTVRPSAWQTVTILLALSAVVFAVAGWWYLRNALLYGDAFGLRVHVNTPWGRSTPASFTTLLAELPSVYRSFWGAFGWGHVQLPLAAYVTLGLGVGASLAGWFGALKERRLPGRRRAFILAAAWCLLVFAALLQWMRQVEAPHGRLLFPAIAAWALLVAGGWAALPLRWLRPVLLTGLAALSILTPWLVIRPAFAPPALMSPSQASVGVQPADLTYGETALLLGVALDRQSVPPGGRLAVRACWQAVRPMSQDYTIFVQLVGSGNVRVGERRTYPGLGRFPTSLWPVGEAFCDVYRLSVEPWAPVPELYDVVVGLEDEGAGERLAARDAPGVDVALPSVAQVRIAPAEPVSVVPDLALDYRLGENVALIGYDLPGPIEGGAPFSVILYWRAEGRSQADHTVFVHLVDGAGSLVAQHDGPPRQGRYPTSAWRTGDVVPDEHVLQVPPSAAGKDLRLAVGMYRSDSLVRLPVTGPEGPVPDDLVSLVVETE